MKLKKILALMLAVVMILAAFAACQDPTPGPGQPGNDDPVNPGNDDPVVADPVDPYAGKTHAEISDALFTQVLGEFTAAYEKAFAAKTVSERYALMAIAEAKLLGAGVMLPSTANGGNYAISKIVPYSATPVLWGNDSDRFYTYLIVKEQALTPAERDEMKGKWGELRGTGTYLDWAKSYIAGKGYTLADEYVMGYTSDPMTWDALATSEAADSEAIVNTFDGLLEYNNENVQVPALATGYEVSEDGLTYTFTLREGVQWVDYQGTVIEEVTADSFVAAMQHALDAAGGLEYLVDGLIVGVTEYLNEEITDFAQVGVKAVDKYKVAYTLTKEASYFPTMVGYNIFAPMSRAYFLANGGAYGLAAYSEAVTKDSYTYGTSAEKIAYCGPYLVTSATASNSIVFEANPSYWNKDAVNLKKITWRFLDGQNPTESYDLFVEGVFAGAGLNAQALAKAQADGNFEKYAYVSSTDATSFPVFLNVYRACYANYNDATVAVSTMTDLDKVRANLAMQNQNFRLAIVSALDRGSYNATTVGDDLKLTSLVNSYTPGNFVSLTEEVTVDINGTAKTYPAGTFYGAIMQDQITADGLPFKVWDPTLEGGAGASSGYDGWYNVEYCRAQLAKAVEELKAANVEISKEKPIVLEVPYYDVSTVYANRANALKQSIEASTEGLVEVRLVKTGGSNALNWYYATYYPESGDTMNFNMMDNSGWGPDYGDPSTYLDTMALGGYMNKCIGLY